MRGGLISVYIVAPICAWLLAQAFKLLSFKGKGDHLIDLDLLYRSGGMPSAHTAVVITLATLVGIKQGFDSAVFGVAGITAMIVIYDAINVRYIVGEHGKIIARLLERHGELSKELHAPKIISGHTLSEVFAGTVLGVVVAVVATVITA